MTPLKVLILDAHDSCVGGITTKQDTIHLEGTLFPGTDEYYAEQPLLDFLAALEPNAYDLIIIGNNLGSGYAKAKAIPESLRSRGVITWNDEPGNRSAPYARMGYQYFVSRRNLFDWLIDNPQIYRPQA